eukprot:2523201-Amphidinium_carterae.1
MHFNASPNLNSPECKIVHNFLKTANTKQSVLGMPKKTHPNVNSILPVECHLFLCEANYGTERQNTDFLTSLCLKATRFANMHKLEGAYETIKFQQKILHVLCRKIYF